MSSIKLKHSGGNSVSIAAPSSNPAANRTITLNDNYAGDGSFVTANSSGNVGIGDSSPDRELVVKNASSNSTIKIEASNASTSQLFFSDTDAENVGRISVFHGSGSDQNSMIFDTAGSNRLAITSAGNIGVSTISPVAQTLAGGTAITPVLDLKGTSQNNTSGVLQFTRKDNSVQGSCIYSSGDDAGLTFRNTDGNGFGFYNGTTQALRIDPSGRVLINTTSTLSSEGFLQVACNSNTDGVQFHCTDTSNTNILEMKHANATGSDTGFMIGFRQANGTMVGSIVSNGSSTAYNTSSDYRLKENVTAISDGITRLKTLKPYKFNFIGDSRIIDGFLAHEVTAVPEAITGTKDEVDSDNKPVYQGIDQSKLVPLLTAALQEEVAKREALEARVAALEAA